MYIFLAYQALGHGEYAKLLIGAHYECIFAPFVKAKRQTRDERKELINGNPNAEGRKAKEGREMDF